VRIAVRVIEASSAGMAPDLSRATIRSSGWERSITSIAARWRRDKLAARVTIGTWSAHHIQRKGLFRRAKGEQK
jgi:hypothetical protein